METAIVTDFLNQLGGAEMVTCELARLYPDADIYALMAKDNVLDEHFPNRNVLQHPKLENSRLRRRYYRKLFPFYPTYIEDFDLKAYDLVISSSYLWAKGVLCRPDALHISYIHTPMRQAWIKYHEYLQNENDVGRFSRTLLRYVMNYMRQWDVISANRVDHFIANSTVVKQRIEKIYRRKATVIHPPVKVQELQHAANESIEDYFITVGRLVPYKRVDLIIETFNKLPDKKLLIVGDGNDKQRLEKMVQSNNISLLGYLKEDKKNELVAKARAFIFAAEEDFGMSPVEAMALGTPVIAYNKGGTKDYIREGINGCFFDHQSIESIKNGITKFEKTQFNQYEVMESVTSFDEKCFHERFKIFVDSCLQPMNPR